MSPRAAARLDTLGFEQVYDYAAGKEDWTAAGLPTEGHALQHVARIIDLAVRVPSCELSDTVGVALSRLNEGDRRVVMVTTDDGVILGRLRKKALESDPQTPVEDVMEIGPSTFRADVEIKTLVDRMQRKNVASVPVTNAGGQLLGVFYRVDGERYLSRHNGGLK
jgi:predicted transcriptional regulator